MVTTSYITAGAILASGWAFLFGLDRIVFSRLKRRVEQTASHFDDFLYSLFHPTLIPLLYYGVFYLAVQDLPLGPPLQKLIRTLGAVLLTYLGIRFISISIRHFIFNYWIPKNPDRRPLEGQFTSLMPIITITVWTVGVLFLLDNLGFKISAIVAGLGIGGVAVALASQSVLGDLFSYFSIMFDKPFMIGDFIIVGNFMGSVEYIGIKTTRLRSLSGEQLVFSNKQLTDSTVSNYKRMVERRIEFGFSVTLHTPPEKVKRVPGMVKKIIMGVQQTRFDRAHFSAVGDYNLKFVAVYFVLSSDFNKYMDIQQDINVKLLEEFQKEGIEMATPVQRVLFERSADRI